MVISAKFDKENEWENKFKVSAALISIEGFWVRGAFLASEITPRTHITNEPETQSGCLYGHFHQNA